jgi:hypothetical protein
MFLRSNGCIQCFWPIPIMGAGLNNAPSAPLIFQIESMKAVPLAEAGIAAQ